MITRYSSLEELEQLAPLWKEYGKSQGTRVFQTYDWCRLGWEDCLSKDSRNRLYVLKWSQENIADSVIFPFYVDGAGTLRFIMDCDSDVGDCIYAVGFNHHIAFKEALDYILRDQTINTIRLEKLEARSEILDYWGSLSLRRSKVEPVNAYSLIDVSVSEDFAASQPQLRSKDKANIRAIKRKADKYQLQLLSHAEGKEYPAEVIDAIASSMRKKGIRENSFLLGDFADFCRDVYNQGLSDILELIDAGGEPVAVNFILKEGHRRLSWVFLYTHAHASTELYVKYFYEFTKDMGVTFDFGSGCYDYKIGSFRPEMHLLYRMTIPLTRRARLTELVRTIWTDAKSLIKFTIDRK